MKGLITKLTGVVQNVSIPKIGTIKLVIKSDNKVVNMGTWQGLSAVAVTGKILETTSYFTDATGVKNNGREHSRKLSLDSNTYIYVKDVCSLELSRKYDLSSFILRIECENQVDLDTFSYSNNLTNLDLTSPSVEGDISSLSNLVNLTNLDLTSPSVKGDISSLSNLVNLTNLRISSANLTGDISSLGKLVNITSINFSYSKLETDIKPFADALLKNGVRNKTVNVITEGKNSKITYNGTTPTKKKWQITFTDSAYSVENLDI